MPDRENIPIEDFHEDIFSELANYGEITIVWILIYTLLATPKE